MKKRKHNPISKSNQFKKTIEKKDVINEMPAWISDFSNEIDELAFGIIENFKLHSNVPEIKNISHEDKETAYALFSITLMGCLDYERQNSIAMLQAYKDGKIDKREAMTFMVESFKRNEKHAWDTGVVELILRSEPTSEPCQSVF